MPLLHGGVHSCSTLLKLASVFLNFLCAFLENKTSVFLETPVFLKINNFLTFLLSENTFCQKVATKQNKPHTKYGKIIFYAYFSGLVFLFGTPHFL